MTGATDRPAADERADGADAISASSGAAVTGTVGGSDGTAAIEGYADPGPSRPQRAVEALDSRLPYLLLLPALSLVVALVAYPAVWAVALSLHEVPLVELDALRFVGLDNYVHLFGDDRFWLVLRNTVAFVGASVLGQVAIGLGLALLLERSWLDGGLRRLVRLTYLLPWATTGVVVAYSWSFLFDTRFGLVNRALRWVGVANPPAWLDSVTWAMVAVVVANVWRGVPFSFLIQTSGLQSIPDRCYEAAAVGGASRLQTARHVTAPLLAPFLAANLVLVTLFTVTVFDVVYVMTGGGPLRSTEVLSLHMYEVAFDTGAFGRASAIAVVLFGCNLAVVGCYLAASRWTGGGRT